MLKEAFDQLLDQLFAHQFPAHPRFDVEVKQAGLKKVHAVLDEAASVEGGRVLVTDRAVRQLVRSIANPLQLGTMGETHFVLGHHWRQHFDRLHAAHGGPMTVAKLRAWMDEPQAMGLAKEVGNLVILTFSAQTNRSFFLHGARVVPTLDSLADELELREEALPSATDWKEAIQRSQRLFGLVPAETLNAANVAALISQLRARSNTVKPAVDGLCRSLPEKLRNFGIDASSSDRLTTTRSAQGLLTKLTEGSDDQLITLLANADIRTSDTAMSQTIGKAGIIDECVRTTDWELFDAVRKLTDGRKAAAENIIARVIEALTVDEHATAMKPAIDMARREALQLLTVVPPPPPPPPPPPRSKVIDHGVKHNLSRAAAEDELSSIGRRLSEDLDYRLDIDWKITKGDKGQ
jgi:hypothetical protein